MKYSRREAADKANPDVQHTGCLTHSCFKQLDLRVTYHPWRSQFNIQILTSKNPDLTKKYSGAISLLKTKQNKNSKWLV